MGFDVALAGELPVCMPTKATGTFSAVQQWLNCKTTSPKMQTQYPAFVRCYDLLQLDGEDLRSLAFTARRQQIETFIATLDPGHFDLSPLVPFNG